MKYKILTLSLLVLFILSACGHAAAEKVTIKLAAGPWSSSETNVAVAKILLEEQMGYTVEIIALDENTQWSALADGDVHGVLEVWPSGHIENVAKYIDGQKTVDHAGLLGVTGALGWYMPKYMLDRDPDLATWQGFQKPETAALFATADTGDKGQFLAGDQTWIQHDADIIHNLNLNFEVIVAGSEAAQLIALETAYSQEEPLLFYWWTPHSAFAKYDLVKVELPAYSDECYAKQDLGGIDCDYPAEDLYKIVSSQLKDIAPEVDQFLRNFNYSDEDQIELIAAVELDGKSAEEAARAWIEKHESTWRSWIP